MVKSKGYLYLCFFSVILLFSCKKDVDTKPYAAPEFHCENLYTNLSLDTNYIPHKKNNSWTYCNSNGDYYSKIFVDTIKSGNIYFEYVDNYGLTSHNSMGCICDINKIFIDSIGNYFSLRTDYTYLVDTMKIIDLNASNGDTIFKSKISPHYVLLVNKNDVFESITNCYHIKIIFPEHNRIDEYYYRRGLGIVWRNNSKLINANIQ